MVAIYDHNCGLCRNFAAMLRRLTHPAKLDVVPCGSGIQQKLAPHVTLEECRKSFLFIDEEGRILEGGDAASKAISIAPGLSKYSGMIRSKAGRAVARALYAGTRLLRQSQPKCCDKEPNPREEI